MDLERQAGGLAGGDGQVIHQGWQGWFRQGGAGGKQCERTEVVELRWQRVGDQAADYSAIRHSAHRWLSNYVRRFA